MTGLDLVIARLPKPLRLGPKGTNTTRSYRSWCPVCEAHGQPLSLAETRDALPLIHCFGGCSPLDVLQALGLGWSDILPKLAWHFVKGNAGPSAWGSLAAALDALFDAHCRVLATCAPGTDEVGGEVALRALLEAGEAMQHVKSMARRAMRGDSK